MMKNAIEGAGSPLPNAIATLKAIDDYEEGLVNIGAQMLDIIQQGFKDYGEMQPKELAGLVVVVLVGFYEGGVDERLVNVAARCYGVEKQYKSMVDYFSRNND